MQNMCAKGSCNCHHHKALPVLVMLFGLDFLLGAMGILTPGFVAITWPIIVIAIGAMKFMNKSGMCKCC